MVPSKGLESKPLGSQSKPLGSQSKPLGSQSNGTAQYTRIWFSANTFLLYYSEAAAW